MRRSLLLFVVGLTSLLAFVPSAESQGKKKPKAPLWSDQKDAFGDPLPIGAVARIGTSRYRLPEAGSPQAVALTPDGKLLAVLGLGGDIEIWELPAWKRQRLLRGRSFDKNNPPQFLGLTFSPDSKKLVTFYANQQCLHVIDVATGKALKKLALGKNDPRGAPTLTLLRDGQTLVGSFNIQVPNGNMVQEVQIWDLAKDKLTRSFPMPMDRSAGQSPRVISADGRWLAQALLDEEAIAKDNRVDAYIEIWDLKTGKLARKIETDGGMLMPKLAYSPDGKWLAASNGQSILRIYDADTGKERHNIRLRRAPLSHLEFSPDSASLYVADQDGKITLWDPASGERTASHAIPNSSAVRHLVFQPDGKVLALGYDMDAVHLWEVATGKQLSPTGVPASVITEVAFAANGDLFVAAEDGFFAWWNPRTGAKLRDLKLELPSRDEDGIFRVVDVDPRRPRTGLISSVTMSQNGEFLANTNGNSLSFHDAKTGKLLYDDELNNAGDRAVTFLDGGSKVAAMQGKKVRVWNARSGRDLAVFNIPLRKHEIAVKLSASPNGKHFAVVTTTNEGVGRALLWDVDSKKIVRELPAGPGNAIQFSPDGQWLALTGAGGLETAQLTRVGAAKGETLLKLGGEVQEISRIAFAPDGRQLALAVIVPTGDRDKSRLVIFEMASKKIRLELVGHEAGVIESLSFARDGGLLASGASDTTVLVWQAGLRAFLASPPGKGVGAEGKPAAAADLADWYQQIAGTNPKAAFQHMIKLAQVPKQAVKLFEDKIAPAKKPDAGEKTIPQWIHDLGSGTFAVRSKASAMLQKIGMTVEPDLRAALPKATDVETKRRIEELLDRFALHEWTQEEVLHARAVEVLETLATPEARTLLTRWSEGDPGAVLTQEARKALNR